MHNNDLSARPCGCDPGCSYMCDVHARRLFPPDDFFIPTTDRTPTTEELKAAHPEDRKLWRKQRPVYSGVLAYFPDALMEVAYVSWLGNQQHNPGQPLHWAREKSTDHLDCIARHLIDHSKDPVDDDGGLHLAKDAWRALAALQLYLEAKKETA